MTETTGLIASPLHDLHTQLGAKFGEFAGWQMPLEYAGVRAEHTAVRERAGLFDVSHLGSATVRGQGATDTLNRVFTNDVHRIPVGKAQYTLLLDDQANVVDDLIIYHVADEDFLLVPNAANSNAVLAAVIDAAPATVTVHDAHRELAILALQGPAAFDIFAELGGQVDADYMGVSVQQLAGISVVVCRSGYTGEKGLELIVSAQQSPALWTQLLQAGESYGLLACGLGARDTLRTEMSYPLHGQDLGNGIDLIAAGCSWAVAWDKPAFRGQQAALQQREQHLGGRIRTLKLLDRGVPRPGMTVHRSPEGAAIGQVTSGTFSPTLGCGIALALLPAEVAMGDEVVVAARGRWLRAEVVAPPLVPSRVR